jgi:transposase
MPPTLPSSRSILRGLMRRDPDPRRGRRAHALLLVAEGQPLAHVARLFHTAPHRVRAWRTPFLARGRAGLGGAPRPGRPPKLSPAAVTRLAEAMSRSPQAYGFLPAGWSVRDLGTLWAHKHGLRVCAATIYRALLGLGDRDRRPCHDRRHRQAPQAVAAARQVLDWLKTNAPQVLAGCEWSAWTSAQPISTPGWRRPGRNAATR